jgi:hypothetical protein
MKAVSRRDVLALLGCAICASAVGAEEARQIGWDQLTVKLAASENPFARLSADQLEALVDVAAIRERRRRGVPVTAEQAGTERAAAARLQQAGIDVDELLARRSEIAAKQKALAGTPNPAVDGLLIRLAGHVLPLEFADRQVSEFLLVPWVGACIHTPPPPPNQIVHVKADPPFEMMGMFEAVWVTGRLAASAARKSVQIVDGSSDVDVGYSMRANRVERYNR